MRSWWFGADGPSHDVVMYTRRGCHLCDDAWHVLQQAARRYSLSLRQVDIDDNPALVAEHGLCVPVVVIDGKIRFRGAVNAVLLERILRAKDQDSA